jgi:uncharacterized protein YpmS
MSDRHYQATYIVAVFFLLAIIVEYIVITNSLETYQDVTEQHVKELQTIITEQNRLIETIETEITSQFSSIQELEYRITELENRTLELEHTIDLLTQESNLGFIPIEFTSFHATRACVFSSCPREANSTPFNNSIRILNVAFPSSSLLNA